MEFVCQDSQLIEVISLSEQNKKIIVSGDKIFHAIILIAPTIRCGFTSN